MKFCKNLYLCYNNLKKSDLILNKDNSKESIDYFQNILNKSQPKTQEDITLNRFVKSMYYENKNSFLTFIKNTNFECLILWTESVSILKQLGLLSVVYCKWIIKDSTYYVTRFKSNSYSDNYYNENKNHEHPLVKQQRYKSKNIKHTPDGKYLTNDTTPDLTNDTTPDLTNDTTPDLTNDTTPDLTNDTTPDCLDVMKNYIDGVLLPISLKRLQSDIKYQKGKTWGEICEKNDNIK
jgi:hypothetical protein